MALAVRRGGGDTGFVGGHYGDSVRGKETAEAGVGSGTGSLDPAGEVAGEDGEVDVGLELVEKGVEEVAVALLLVTSERTVRKS